MSCFSHLSLRSFSSSHTSSKISNLTFLRFLSFFSHHGHAYATASLSHDCEHPPLDVFTSRQHTSTQFYQLTTREAIRVSIRLKRWQYRYLFTTSHCPAVLLMQSSLFEFSRRWSHSRQRAEPLRETKTTSEAMPATPPPTLCVHDRGAKNEFKTSRSVTATEVYGRGKPEHPSSLVSYPHNSFPSVTTGLLLVETAIAGKPDNLDLLRVKIQKCRYYLHTLDHWRHHRYPR